MTGLMVVAPLQMTRWIMNGCPMGNTLKKGDKHIYCPRSLAPLRGIIPDINMFIPFFNF
jgi:hypothetical protein